MSDCPICDFEFTDSVSMENGEWGMEYVDLELDYYCLEWDGDRATIYYHEE